MVQNGRVLQDESISARDVKAVSIVRGSETIGSVVRCFASSIVQHDILQEKAIAAADAEAMNRIILDIQILDDRVSDCFADSNEVVWLAYTSIGSKSVPPSLSIAIDNSIWLGGDDNIGSGDFDHVVIRIGILESSFTSKGDGSACLELGEVKRGISRDDDAVESYGCA